MSARVSLLLVLLIAALPVPSSLAAEVQLRANLSTLNARLLLPEEAGLGGGVTMLVHDTFGTADDPEIRTLQEALLSAGRASLAITLSLGVDDRRSEYDCARAHLHRHEQAVVEIAAWTTWLRAQGAPTINLLGVGRGANQAAWYVAEIESRGDKLNGGTLLLVQPPRYRRELAEATYTFRFGYEIEPLLSHARRLLRRGQPRALIYRVDFLGCRDTSVSAAALLSYYGDDYRRHTPALLHPPTVPTVVFLDSGNPDSAAIAAQLRMETDGAPLRLHWLPPATAQSRLEALTTAVLAYQSPRALDLTRRDP